MSQAARRWPEEYESMSREQWREFVDGRAFLPPVPVRVEPFTMREFDTGATRNVEDPKHDFEAFLSPAVLARYAEYMHANRQCADGTVRDGDNWQKGIPKDAYMKSAWRHFMDLWLHHRGESERATEDVETACCALMFNVMGYLFEHLRKVEDTSRLTNTCSTSVFVGESGLEEDC